jgi:glycosyltransferase involved in cell wall biosynthesis
LVDVSRIIEPAGVYTLSKNLIVEFSKKRPNWKFIIMYTKDQEYLWENVEGKNIEPLHVAFCDFFGLIFLAIDHMPFSDLLSRLIYNFPKCIRELVGKLKFFLLYARLLPHIDLFFDPITTLHLNNFYLPRVSTIHDLLYHDLPKLSYSYTYAKKATETAIKYSDKIIAVSNFSKRRIFDLFDVADEKVCAIHTMLSKRLKKSANNGEEILKKYGLSKNNYLIYPSCFWKHKNQHGLIQAFAKYIKLHKADIKLLLSGFSLGVPNEKYIPSDIKDKVVITGFVDNKTLQIFIENSLALIHPSLYEGFGMTILEGMAAGKAVTASRVASIPEIGGNAVLYFDPYNIDDMCNAIHEIISKSELRNDLIKKGLERVKVFSNKESMIDQYIAAFEAVL